MTVTIDENGFSLFLKKLDNAKLELICLRAMFLPKEKATIEEKKEIAAAKKEMEKETKNQR